VTQISRPARASFRSTPWRSPTLFTRDVTARRARYRKCLHELEECIFHSCDNISSAFVEMQEPVGQQTWYLDLESSDESPSPAAPPVPLWGEPGHYSGGFVYLVRSSAVTIFARLFAIGSSNQGADIVHNGVQYQQERRLLLPWSGNRNIHRSTSTSISVHIYTWQVCFADHNPGTSIGSPTSLGLQGCSSPLLE